MAKTNDIPSLAKLALQYGTITQDQFRLVSSLKSSSKNLHLNESDILLKQGLATRYQLNLLTLIQEYLVIRKKSEEFGRIAVKKGYATRQDIILALEIQKTAFRKERLHKLIGDILVESDIITPEQKNYILKEQLRLSRYSPESASEEKKTISPFDKEEILLSQYEKQFLSVKALDQDFAAAVLEKGYAAEDDILKAIEFQESAFRGHNRIKILGEILVDLKKISEEQKDLILKEQNRSSDGFPDSISVPIEIKDNNTVAWVTFTDTSQVLSVDQVKQVLAEKGIRLGIYPDAVLQSALDYRLPSFPVAKVDYSVALGLASRLKSYIETGLSDSGEKKKGDVLAEQGPRPSLGPQKNLFDQLSERISDKDFTLRCGSGTRISHDQSKILAFKTGKPSLSVERYVYIHPVINVLEDADQRYGPVEAYSDLTVSGTVTGAYRVTCGRLRANEIRGGRVEAVGDIRIEVGITDSVIRAQGDIYARYLHGCRIETFGSLYVENEIMDSDVKCSGKIDSPGCRVVSSNLSAKLGVCLHSIGSLRTRSCTIIAGAEHHIMSQVSQILEKIDALKNSLTPLIEKRTDLMERSRLTFEKMVEIKIFHDRSKKIRLNLEKELRRPRIDNADKIANLVENLKGRMEKAISSLKELNATKKRIDQSLRKLEDQVARLSKKIDKQVKAHEQTLYAYLEWTRDRTGISEIQIKGLAFEGSVLKGVYSQIKLSSNKEEFAINVS